MYLALNVAALMVFVAALVVALVFSLVWPLVLVALAIAVLAAGQLAVGARLLHASLSIWFGSWGRSYQLLSAIWLATLGGDDDEPPEVQRVPMALLPKLSGVLNDLTTALATRPIAAVAITLDANASVSFGRRLTLGLPLLYLLTGDELRAVLAHEVAHIRAWHTFTGRFVHACIIRLDRTIGTHSFSVLSPVTWVALGWLAFLKATFLRWRRKHEFEADALAAGVAGGDHLISGFRRMREEAGYLSDCQRVLEEHAYRTKTAPHRLVEAAARLASQTPVAMRRRISRAAEGDPLDSEDRTHPSTAHRIAALRAAPSLGPRFARSAILEFTDVIHLEEPLTKRTLGGAVVPASDFVRTMQSTAVAKPEGSTWRDNAVDLADLADVKPRR